MKALFLFDTTGYAAEPFTKAGWETYIIDILNTKERAQNSRATKTKIIHSASPRGFFQALYEAYSE